MKDIMNNHVLELRHNTTEAEKRIWHFLRAKRLNGYKFRQQHYIHPYIVDFVCLETMLIVELDGGQHAEQIYYDEKRTRSLEAKGFKVMRFWNNQALGETREVLETILFELEKRKAKAK